MPAITIPLDERTNRHLEEISRTEGVDAEIVASRLLRRAVLRGRSRRQFDVEAVRQGNEAFEAEDIALAESDSAARNEALLAEDAL